MHITLMPEITRAVKLIILNPQSVDIMHTTYYVTITIINAEIKWYCCKEMPKGYCKDEKSNVTCL